MNLLTKKVSVVGLTFLCSIVYFTSYLTRYSYAAALTAIISDLSVSKQIASIAITGAFISYGIGQIISGILGDKFPPRVIIFTGLLMSSLINLTVCFLKDIIILNIIWFFNGFFQSLIWPPLVRILAANMNRAQYKKATLFVFTASSLASVVVYLIFPLAINISGWRAGFTVISTIGIIVSFIWILMTKNISNHIEKHAEITPNLKKDERLSVIPMLIPILFLTASHGVLKDGISTWMPTYIFEVFKLGISNSIVSAAILPVFGIVSFVIVSWIDSKFKNELKSSALLFTLSFISSVALVFIYSTHFIPSVIFMAVISGSMHGINLMLVSHTPLKFSNHMGVSTVSGIINAATYIGSALSTYGFAFLSETFGWEAVILSWCVLLFLSIIISVLHVKKWKIFSN